MKNRIRKICLRYLPILCCVAHYGQIGIVSTSLARALDEHRPGKASLDFLDWRQMRKHSCSRGQIRQPRIPNFEFARTGVFRSRIYQSKAQIRLCHEFTLVVWNRADSQYAELLFFKTLRMSTPEMQIEIEVIYWNVRGFTNN